MRFTIENKHFIKWMWVSKKYVAKRLLKMVFERRRSLDGLYPFHTYAVQAAVLCGSTTAENRRNRKYTADEPRVSVTFRTFRACSRKN